MDLNNELVMIVLSKLKSCEEVSDMRDHLSEDRKQDIVRMLMNVISSKAKTINIEAVVYKLLCDVLQMNSTSNTGDYARGQGVYQKDLLTFPDQRLHSRTFFTYKHVGKALLSIAQDLSRDLPLHSDDVDAIMMIADLFPDLSGNPNWNRLQNIMNELNREDILNGRDRDRAARLQDNGSEDSDSEISNIYDVSESNSLGTSMELMKEDFDEFIDLVARKLKGHLNKRQIDDDSILVKLSP